MQSDSEPGQHPIGAKVVIARARRQRTLVINCMLSSILAENSGIKENQGKSRKIEEGDQEKQSCGVGGYADFIVSN